MKVIEEAEAQARLDDILDEAQRHASISTTLNIYTHVFEQRRPINGASNAEINRELTLLKRMFTLAVQSRKLLFKPHIPLLEERNTRKGFFEQHQLASVLAHLPGPLRPVITFAFITGWRIRTEVLSLEWRQVDFGAGEIRLDPETTKNRDGRVFPMTGELRSLLEAQQTAAEQVKQQGHLAPWVFFRMVAKGRGGEEAPKRFVRLRRRGRRCVSLPDVRADPARPATNRRP